MLAEVTRIVPSGSSFVFPRGVASIKVISGWDLRKIGSGRGVEPAVGTMEATFIHAGKVDSATIGLWSSSVINRIVIVGYISGSSGDGVLAGVSGSWHYGS